MKIRPAEAELFRCGRTDGRDEANSRFSQFWDPRPLPPKNQVSFSKKHSNTKFHENPPSGRRVIPCGRTDRRDEANSRFLQFWDPRPLPKKNQVSFTKKH